MVMYASIMDTFSDNPYLMWIAGAVLLSLILFGIISFIIGMVKMQVKMIVIGVVLIIVLGAVAYWYYF